MPSVRKFIVAAETLKEHLKLEDLPLSTTDNGRRFTMKALHPSDSTIKSVQVPGRNNNTVCVAIDQIIDMPAGSQGWVDVEVIPHPLCPCTMANSTAFQMFLSPPWGPGAVSSAFATSMTGAMNNFQALAEKYCITSQSVTCELIAPSTASQGTVVACQYSNPTQVFPISPAVYGYTASWGLTRGAIVEVDPSPSVMAAGTRAYNSKAIEGCYMPLRLEDFQYHVPNRDYVSFFNAVAAGTELPAFFEDDCKSYAIARPFYLYSGGAPERVHTVIPTQDNWGKVSFRGLDTSATVRVRVRQTLELVVDPQSSYAPLSETPAGPDDLALRMYFEISARMKDAYPASYNDWETLKKTILSIGRKVLPLASPALSLVTSGLPFGGAINSLGQAALDGLVKKVGVKSLTDQATKKAVNAALQRAIHNRPLPKPPTQSGPSQPSGQRRRKLNVQRRQ